METANTPFVSVVMASYNRVNFITEAIESVLNQSYAHLELLILDDCSTDNSWEIIQNYTQKDKRIIANQNTENKGVGFTKKELLDTANGDIIFIVDADDFILPYAVEILVTEHLIKPDYALIYSNHFVCDAQLNPRKTKSISRKIPKGKSHLCHHGIGHLVSIKKDYYQQISGLNPELKIAVDQDLFYQMEEVGNIYFVDQKLYYYRQNEKSVSLNKNRFKAAKTKVKLMRKAKERRLKNNSLLCIPSNNYLNTLEWYADNQLGRGNILKAVPRAVLQLRLDIVWGIICYHWNERV